MEMEEQLTTESMSFGMLFSHAWRLLKKHLGLLTGAFLLTNLILCAANAFLGCLWPFATLLLAPLNVGLSLLCLTLVRSKEASIQLLFQPFSDYLRYLWGVIRLSLFVLLWSLLLIIPGIVAFYRYSMTLYLLLDHPEYSAKQAMAESCKITKGYKLRMFGYLLLCWLIVIVLRCATIVPFLFFVFHLEFIMADLSLTLMIGLLLSLLLLIIANLILSLLETMMATLATAEIYECIKKNHEDTGSKTHVQYSIEAEEV